LTTAENDSEMSQIAVNSNYIHTVWMDNRDGGTVNDYNIYYKRNPGW